MKEVHWMAKGQGLPITTIIIAALGILVLVVIAAIFSGQIGKIGRVSQICNDLCQSPATSKNLNPQAGCPEGYAKLPDTRLDPTQPTAQMRDPNAATFCNPCCVPVG